MLPLRNYIWKVALICSLLSPFAFFSSGLKPWGTGNPLGYLTQEIIYPIEYLWGSITKSIWNIWDHYIALTEAAKQNTKLRSEINRLRTQLLDYDEQLHESK